MLLYTAGPSASPPRHRPAPAGRPATFTFAASRRVRCRHVRRLRLRPHPLCGPPRRRLVLRRMRAPPPPPPPPDRNGVV